MARETVSKYISLRRNHPAWSLLASPKGPLILASLKSLIDSSPGGVVLEEAVERLATVFADYANEAKFLPPMHFKERCYSSTRSKTIR